MSFERQISFLKLVIAIGLSWYFLSSASGPKNLDNWNFLDSVNLIIHEAGHSIFIFFGEFIHVLAGSFLQITVPVIFAGYFFLWRKEYFSGSLLLFWVGHSILNVAIYMGDSIKMQLDLLGGDGVIHDWNFLLSMTGLLKYTDILSAFTYGLGFFIILTAVVLSIYHSGIIKVYESTTNKHS